MSATTTFNANTIRVNNNLEVGLTADISGNVTIHGETINKGKIAVGSTIERYNGGSSSPWISTDGSTTTMTGNMRVMGNNILSSTGSTPIILSGANTQIAGDIQLDGHIRCIQNTIRNSAAFDRIFFDTGSGDVFLKSRGSFLPETDDAVNIGSSSQRWDNIYATNNTINTSDQRLKKDISECELGLNFINNLRPVSYKWKKEGCKRRHFGLLSQEVKTVLENQGINFSGNFTDDFAGYCYNELEELYDNILVKSEDKEEIVKQEKEYNDLFGLRYAEFIAPMIKAIQELSTKVTEQQAEIDNLKSQINN